MIDKYEKFYTDNNSRNFYDSDYAPEVTSSKINLDLTGYGLDELYMFDELGSTRVNSGYDRLIQSMRIILATPVGSRFFLPSFGSKIHELLFQPNDLVFKDLLDYYIKDAIEKWEPRVKLVDVIIDDSVSKHEVDVTIKFKSKFSNSVDSFIYTVNRQISDLD